MEIILIIRGNVSRKIKKCKDGLKSVSIKISHGETLVLPCIQIYINITSYNITKTYGDITKMWTHLLQETLTI